MKKIVAAALAVLMTVSLCACGKQESDVSEEGNAGLPNPVTEYTSLDEINKLTGSNLMKPGVMGVSDERFAVIDGADKVAEYRFSVNGVEYTMRGSSAAEDISGYYINGKAAFADSAAEEIAYAQYEDIQLARWFTDGQQYVLSGKNVPDSDTFVLVAEELRAAMTPAAVSETDGVNYEELAGQYYDSVSQRAVMTAEACGSGLELAVSWSNSASDCTRWTMTAAFDENGSLAYSDCAKMNLTTAADGTETAEIMSTDGEGYFTLDGGKLLWDGAADENCVSCVFEKAEG